MWLEVWKWEREVGGGARKVGETIGGYRGRCESGERARIIERKDKEGKSVVWAKLGEVEDKKKIMVEKRKLDRRKERIEDNLTWEERKAAW